MLHSLSLLSSLRFPFYRFICFGSYCSCCCSCLFQEIRDSWLEPSTNSCFIGRSNHHHCPWFWPRSFYYCSPKVNVHAFILFILLLYHFFRIYFYSENVKEALSHLGWRAAMQEEIVVLDSNNSWKMVPLPLTRKRLVANWFLQWRWILMVLWLDWNPALLPKDMLKHIELITLKLFHQLPN